MGTGTHMSPAKKRIQLTVLGLLLAVLVACATSPLGRKQLILYSESQMQQMGATAYLQMKQKIPISEDPEVNAYVSCVTQAIVSELDGPQKTRQWEVTVFRDKSANAFALSGGKIGVHTGLLKVATTQDQLATVLGHEVAHVLAKHADERMSTTFATQTGLDVLQALSGSNMQNKQQIFALLGVGAQVGILLPFSRTQESEADKLGLDLMARAGFDPRQSVDLWQNMAQTNGSGRPNFLSTHPSHSTRIRDLQQRIPSAMQLYRRAQTLGKRPQCRP